jgi:hypothetical protein
VSSSLRLDHASTSSMVSNAKTDLAESGAADETIRDIAGHVSKQMLKHYSHIRMAAKRGALEGIVVETETHSSGSSRKYSSGPRVSFEATPRLLPAYTLLAARTDMDAPYVAS